MKHTTSTYIPLESNPWLWCCLLHLPLSELKKLLLVLRLFWYYGLNIGICLFYMHYFWQFVYNLAGGMCMCKNTVINIYSRLRINCGWIHGLKLRCAHDSQLIFIFLCIYLFHFFSQLFQIFQQPTPSMH